MRHIVLFGLTVSLAACGDGPASEGRDPATVPSPVPAGPPVSPPPETPEAAEHAGVEEAHSHGAPHGGSVATAGSGHLEAVVSGSDLVIYVLDANEATMPVDGIAGAQAVFLSGNESHTVPLAAMGEHLMGAIPRGLGAYAAVVTVPVAGEVRSARFEVGADGDLRDVD